MSTGSHEKINASASNREVEDGAIGFNEETRLEGKGQNVAERPQAPEDERIKIESPIQSDKADNSDVEIIHSLCNNVLPEYRIHRGLLINWQVELCDDLTNLSTIIEQDIILSVGVSRIKSADFEAFLERLWELNDDIFHDFKIIIFEILIYVISISYNIKIELYNLHFHRFLIDKLIAIISEREYPLESLHKATILNQVVRLVVIFFELGCDLKSFRKLITFLHRFNGGKSEHRSPVDGWISPKPENLSVANNISSELLTPDGRLSPRKTLLHSHCSTGTSYSPTSTSKLIILELLQQVFTKYPSHFKFALFNTITSFPFTNENLKKKFTIQAWFKINSLLANNDDPITLFILTNSNSSQGKTSLRVQLWNYSKISIEVKNHHNGSRSYFTFNQILKINQTEEDNPSPGSNPFSVNNQGYVHIVLTYDSYSNLNLFLDGDYSESIPCPEIQGVFSSWNKVYIGNEPRENGSDSSNITDEILIKSLTILNTNLSHEWISLLYNLGLGYDWDFKEFTLDNLHNLLNHLDPKGLANVAIKFDRLKNRKGDKFDSGRRHRRVNSLEHSLNHTRDRFLGSSSRDQSQLLNKNRIVASLSKLKQENVLFDINEFYQDIQEKNKVKEEKGKSHYMESMASFIYHNSNSIHRAFYTVGGSSLLLKLIEISLEISDPITRDCSIYKSFSLLFTILKNNWRLSKEFENINGYAILSILLTKYKQNFNPSLTLKLHQEFEEPIKAFNLPGCPSTNILNLILRYSGFDFSNSYGSIIINPFPYRFLLLNFDLFHGTDSFEFLLYHFQILIHGSKYSQYNKTELTKMKLLKKLIQFLKTPSLNSAPLSDSVRAQLGSTITAIVRSESTVDSIKSISLFVIFALYSNECSTEIGVTVLQSLTEIISECNSSSTTLRKFSRSITIHWILLLLNFKNKEVVICGIKLLSQLLRILGSNIIKKFFQVNHGLDILTHFLKEWWDDDKILCLLVLSSFGAEANKDRFGRNDRDMSDEESLENVNSRIFIRAEQEFDLVSVQKNITTNQLVLPEFLILINNLALNSMYNLSSSHGRLLNSNPSSPRKSNTDQEYDLSLSLNVLHLMNEYIESIRVGFNNSKALHTFYLSKEFLDGIFELLGHLKLSTTWNIQLCNNLEIVTNKLIKVLSDFFIENFINDSFMPSFENLSASTRVLILDCIFPKIFEHVNQFVNISNFIFNEKKFLESTVRISNYYCQEFVKKNYYISQQNLDAFITCICSLMELEGRDGRNLGSGLKRLRKELGGLILLKFMKLGCGEEYSQERRVGEEKSIKSTNGRVTPEFSSVQSSAYSTPSKHAPDSPSTPQNQEFQFAEEVTETLTFHFALKFLLYRQMTILQKDILDDKNLGHLLELVLGIFLKSPKHYQLQDTEYTFNFLRTCYLMNQENFAKILSSFQLEEEADFQLLLEVFERLLTKNDEESFHKLTKYPQTTKGLSKSFQKLLTKYTELIFLNVSEMLGVTLQNGGMLGNLNNIYIKSFEKDCDLLRSSIINGELIKYNRFIQDLQENVQFFISSYNVLKFETFRLLNDGARQKNFMLDYIENNSRMRKRLIIEDQIPDSEKLSYNINVPIQKLDQFEERYGFHEYDDAINSSGIDTLSLSEDGLGSVLGLSEDHQEDEGFEIIEDNPTTTYEDKNRKVIRSLFMGDQIKALWNISQINGLVPIESLMILGKSHLYLIENYFHCSDGNVVDVQEVLPEFRDLILQLINSQSSAILKNDGRSHRNKNWSLDKLSAISKRQFLLRDIAIEMFFNDGASILITCLTTKDRDVIYNRLHSFVSVKGLDSDLSEALQVGVTSGTGISGSVLSMGSGSFSFTKLASAFSSPTSNSSSLTSTFITATKKWRMGEISNFYYLMIINTLAGRTFNDLTQYPVFPWVLADYTSDTLDLSNPKTFRDLSKPMGAQSPHRANQFKERFDALKSLNDHDAPAFHYGTHYSSAMIVTSFLIRLKPYVQSYLLLQGGKFDHADRLFNSLQKAWSSASKDNTTDVRELTPEFFYLPEFLVNINNFEFGSTQSGESPNNVELPPWAKNDPKIFIAKNREALESSYVSANLHLWIDLIFGYKQNGPEAEKSLNVFHHLSYNGAINLDNINDDMERKATIGMINNFGQTPQKLFSAPHPIKEVLNLPNYYLTTLSDSGENPKLIFESKLKLPIEKLEISSKNGKRWVGRPSCITSEDDLLIHKANKFKYESGSLIVNQTTFLNIHLSNITAIMQIGHKSFLTGSEDGIINVWKCSTDPIVSLQFQSVLRGHFSPILGLKFSKSFKIGLSVDADHTVIVWDLTRLKFIRKIMPPVPSETVSGAIISISNDSGNIGIVYYVNGHNRLLIYTVNGELIIDQELGGGKIDSFSFGSVNDTMVDTGKGLINNNHTHWSNEIFAVSIQKSIHVYELSPLGECGWQLNCFDSIDFEGFIGGAISTFLLFNHCEVDTDDKLARGVLRLVFGDKQGKVYSI